MLLLRLISCALITGTVSSHAIPKRHKIRTVVTTDMEQDDLASLIRYLLYSNDLDNQGLIYTSSKYHWEGDGKGTRFFLPDREYNTSQTSWRPVGTSTIETHVLPAYAKVYPNLIQHDTAYPTPEHLLSITKVGNVDFEGSMTHDTPGSNLIRSLLLSTSDPRPLYLQAWGGTNTIARALLSIEETHSNQSTWPALHAHISTRTVLLASGFQDLTYTSYIASSWPGLRTINYAPGYATWGYNCAPSTTTANSTEPPRGASANATQYFSGPWIRANIQIGPLGSLYRSWLDGQSTPGGGDQLDIFGDPARAGTGWCKPLEPYAFLSEGDNVVFNALLPTGLERPEDPRLGGWGGRAVRNAMGEELWTGVSTAEEDERGREVEAWSTGRWVEAVQNDFAARVKWSVHGEFETGNHPPVVRVRGGRNDVDARPGDGVDLGVSTHDPDGDRVRVRWWQYPEEGTYPGIVEIVQSGNDGVEVKVPKDAEPGQTVSIIVQGTDDGEFPLTRYDRVMIRVV